jgi:hypothetical protein
VQFGTNKFSIDNVKDISAGFLVPRFFIKP